MDKADCDRIRENIKTLEDQWQANLYTKNKAGGNSGDNEKLIKLRGLLAKYCGNNKKK